MSKLKGSFDSLPVRYNTSNESDNPFNLDKVNHYCQSTSVDLGCVYIFILGTCYPRFHKDNFTDLLNRSFLKHQGVFSVYVKTGFPYQIENRKTSLTLKPNFFTLVFLEDCYKRVHFWYKSCITPFIWRRILRLTGCVFLALE